MNSISYKELTDFMMALGKAGWTIEEFLYFFNPLREEGWRIFKLFTNAIRKGTRTVGIRCSVDCNTIPSCSERRSVINHQKMGRLRLELGSVMPHMVGKYNPDAPWRLKTRAMEVSKKYPVLNACLLDFWLKNPRLIPKELQGVCSIFPGTIYIDQDAEFHFVRCLRFDYEENVWRGTEITIDGPFNDMYNGEQAAIIIKRTSRDNRTNSLEINLDSDDFYEFYRMFRHYINKKSVKRLCSKNVLRELRKVLYGFAKINAL